MDKREDEVVEYVARLKKTEEDNSLLLASQAKRYKEDEVRELESNLRDILSMVIC